MRLEDPADQDVLPEPPYSQLNGVTADDVPEGSDLNIEPIGIPTRKSRIYVVWQGRVRGIFWNWEDARASVYKYSGCSYAKFSTLRDARIAWFTGGKYCTRLPKDHTPSRSPPPPAAMPKRTRTPPTVKREHSPPIVVSSDEESCARSPKRASTKAKGKQPDRSGAAPTTAYRDLGSVDVESSDSDGHAATDGSSKTASSSQSVSDSPSLPPPRRRPSAAASAAAAASSSASAPAASSSSSASAPRVPPTSSKNVRFALPRPKTDLSPGQITALEATIRLVFKAPLFWIVYHGTEPGVYDSTVDAFLALGTTDKAWIESCPDRVLAHALFTEKFMNGDVRVLKE